MNHTSSCGTEHGRPRPRLRYGLAIVAAIVVCGCASRPSVTVTRPLAADADAPYEKILVVSLFSAFDARRWLETEIVNALEAHGVDAVRSTSMMNTRTPIVPQTFIDMVEETGADALLLTQLTSYAFDAREKDARPEATYNYWPTHYFNVFAVELTEYVEPPRLNIEHDVVLAVQVFSVRDRAPVWGIDSRSRFTEVQEERIDYGIFVDEAQAIVTRLERDGLLRR